MTVAAIGVGGSAGGSESRSSMTHSAGTPSAPQAVWRATWLWVLRTGPSMLTLAAAGALALTQALGEALSHDEHQFVAAGWLMGAEGLLPYRDFPFQHLPNLPLLYALLGRLTPSLLLNARLLSAASGLGTAALLYRFARRRLAARGFWPGWIAGTAAVLFLGLSPLFVYTSSRAWNHAFPTMLTVAAFSLLLDARGGRGDRWWSWLICGLLLGIAAGARATFLAAVLPMAAFAHPRHQADGPVGPRRRLAMLLGGCALGLAPTVLLAALAPRQFLYGNLIYPLQNTQYRQLLLHDDAMNLPAKLGYFADQVLLDPVHLALAVGGLWLAWNVRARPGREPAGPAGEVALAFGIAAVLWVGALLPTPSWYQYYYAPLPFVLLGLTALLARAAHRPARRSAALGLAMLALLALRVEAWGELRLLAHPADWLPVQVHQLGTSVSRHTGPGRVLSLAPLVPLEGGLDIYPAFSTGSLTWRVSPFMDRDRRQWYGVISPEDLSAYLEHDPPAAILVGFELANEGFSLDDPGGLEIPLLDYAREHAYRLTQVACPLCLGNQLQVWIDGDA